MSHGIHTQYRSKIKKVNQLSISADTVISTAVFSLHNKIGKLKQSVHDKINLFSTCRNHVKKYYTQYSVGSNVEFRDYLLSK